MHPNSRLDRRYLREKYIHKRLNIRNTWYFYDKQYLNNQLFKDPDFVNKSFDSIGKLSKSNLGCGCRRCRTTSLYELKGMKRDARKEREFDFDSWQGEY